MELTFKNLQDYTAYHYKKYNDDQGLFMKLVEEIGEVAEVMNKRRGRKASDLTDVKAALAAELAEVVHYAVAIAAINDIDLASAILQKDEKAAVKYQHDINLRDFLRKIENNPDF